MHGIVVYGKTDCVMKKLLIFCDYYLPSTKAGGPLRSISAIVNTLQTHFDISIITRNHDLCESTPYESVAFDQWIRSENYRICYLSKEDRIKKIYALLQETAYDIIYFNSFFSPFYSVIPQWILLKLQSKSRRVISPRGELGAGALSIKPWRKKIFLFACKNFYSKKHMEFLAASDQEKKEIDILFSNKFSCTKIDNLIYFENHEKENLNKIENNIRIIFLSRISKKKNLLFALETLKNATVSIQMDIFGLIEEPEYWKKCLALITTLPKHIVVTYRGELDPDKVTQTMARYDLFYLPTLHENYGYVIVEALFSGCPVLLSDQTPWRELESYYAGFSFPLSQPQLFSDAINRLGKMNESEFNQYRMGAKNYFRDYSEKQTAHQEYQCYFAETV